MKQTFNIQAGLTSLLTAGVLVLGAAVRRQGRAAEAKAILEPIVASQPDYAFAQVELGLLRDAELHRRPARAAARHPARPTHPTRAPPPCCAGWLSELAAEGLPPRRPRQNPASASAR